MAQYEGAQQRDMSQTYGEAEGISGWAVGFIALAAFMMMLVGTFHFIEGLAAVLNSTFYTVRDGYDLKVSVNTWGWVQMVGGIVVGLSGLFLLTGNIIARILAVIVVFASMIWSFFSIPYYPVWSILVVAIDIGVLWAIIAHGGDMAKAASE